MFGLPWHRSTGCPLNPEILRIGAAVKVVTYYDLDLHPTPDGWQATVVFDV